MLGHLNPNNCKLPKDIRTRYQTIYCSLCNSLNKQYSLPYSVFINTELTLVLLAFSKYFDGLTSSMKCPTSAFIVNKNINIHKAIDLSADFSIILGWLKLIDIEVDKPTSIKSFLKRRVEKQINKSLPKLPKKTQSIINEYIPLIVNKSPYFEKLKKHSGLLAQQIATDIGDQTNVDKENLVKISALFYTVGQIVLIADNLLDIEKDIQTDQYNSIIECTKKHNSSIEIEYNKLYVEYNSICYQLFEDLSQIKQDSITSDEFISAISNSIVTLTNRIKQKRKRIIPDTKVDSNLDFYEKLIKNKVKPLLVQNNLCECTSSVCEYEGCGDCKSCRKTCYGDSCYNCCCGGDWFGADSSGCTCCGHSYWGEACVGYTNCCDCICGCDGGNGCCFSLSMWTNAGVILLLWFISKWIFDNTKISLLIVTVALVFAVIRFLKKSKNA